MVFSSVPLFLDPPNWHQHPNINQQQLQGGGSGNENHHLLPPQAMPQPPPPPQAVMGGGGVPPIRPNSMAERARLAKIPPPEAPLKCPRCESTNTKFCYYNNYNLSQPRHFCKTCRRYWTRGGALRNVPVGGGCRRNKRPSSKSSSGGSGGGGGSASSCSSKSSLSSSPSTAVGGGHMDLMGSTGLGPGPTIGGIRSGGMTSFMASLQNIAQIGMGNLGLTFGECGSGSGSGPGSLHNPLSGLTGGDHQSPLDFSSGSLLNHPHPSIQFPNLLGGFEVPGSALYSTSFQGDHHPGVDDGQNQVNENVNLNVDVNINGGISKSCSSMMSQVAGVKMEDGQGLNLAKQLMGISSTSENATDGNQFWSGSIPNTAAATTMWTDLSGLNSSSSRHLL